MNTWKKIERLLELKELQGYVGLDPVEQEEYYMLLTKIWEEVR